MIFFFFFLERGPDDSEEIIRKRIQDFNLQTREALQYYSNFGKVVNINADGLKKKLFILIEVES